MQMSKGLKNLTRCYIPLLHIILSLNKQAAPDGAACFYIKKTKLIYSILFYLAVARKGKGGFLFIFLNFSLFPSIAPIIAHPDKFVKGL